jgi:hypothetical protein
MRPSRSSPRRAQIAISRASRARSVRKERGRLPADHIAREDVDDERYIDPAGMGLDVGQVGHPQAIRSRCAEVTVDQVLAASLPPPGVWCGLSCRGRRRGSRGRASGARRCSGPPGHPRAVFLRHWIWWTPDGRRENWEPWRCDRVEELRTSAIGWALPPAVDGDLPEERERHMVEVATSLGKSRVRGTPRSKLRGQSDRETSVRLLGIGLSLVRRRSRGHDPVSGHVC